eukprot:TRINITY_DN17778_c0_g1_i1.p1 TRINITY_DN17778_c0_g1~~TRINITY_DN17778_c0_g1_i1.p1  ORF type:complete len:150 (-),score=45.20 TRINITY_DN17778_c0_g1_i1:39-488(-)
MVGMRSVEEGVMWSMRCFFFSSRRRHTRCREVSWARRCVQETVSTQSTWGRKKFHEEVKGELRSISSIYEKDKDFAVMRRNINEAFTQQFEEGFQNYLDGNWNQAVENMKKALVVNPTDGPTITLLNYMENRNCQAPITWIGVRELTEK